MQNVTSDAKIKDKMIHNDEDDLQELKSDDIQRWKIGKTEKKQNNKKIKIWEENGRWKMTCNNIEH